MTHPHRRALDGQMGDGFTSIFARELEFDGELAKRDFENADELARRNFVLNTDHVDQV